MVLPLVPFGSLLIPSGSFWFLVSGRSRNSEQGTRAGAGARSKSTRHEHEQHDHDHEQDDVQDEQHGQEHGIRSTSSTPNRIYIILTKKIV